MPYMKALVSSKLCLPKTKRLSRLFPFYLFLFISTQNYSHDCKKAYWQWENQNIEFVFVKFYIRNKTSYIALQNMKTFKNQAKKTLRLLVTLLL